MVTAASAGCLWALPLVERPAGHRLAGWRIVSAVRPNIVFTDTISGNPTAGWCAHCSMERWFHGALSKAAVCWMRLAQGTDRQPAVSDEMACSLHPDDCVQPQRK